MYKGVEVPPLGMGDNILSISKCSEQSIAMNSALNSFVESKKLKLKQSKWRVLHVWKNNQCSDFRVHKEKMHKDESATYLGDIIHKSGKAVHNINEICIKAKSIQQKFVLFCKMFH